MYRPRIIPVILIDKDDQAVKTIGFNKRNYIGDPVNTVSLFNSFSIDELVLLNIDCSINDLAVNYQLLKEIAQEAKMPFAIGGGIKTLSDIREILSIGAEKVIISNKFLQDPFFLKEAVSQFGSSSIVICLDVKRDLFGNEHVMFGKKKYQKSLNEVLDYLELYEAGEVIIQSVNKDGQMKGYDSKLLKYVSDYLTIPTVALGGCSSLNEIKSISKESNVSGFAAGSLFVYNDENRGVLINYPDLDDLNSLYKQ